MTTTSVHPLSGFGKAWPVPDFSLEGRRAKASTTLPVGLFILGDSRSPSTTLKHPDEEKGRSLRSSSRSTSTNGLFASSDAVNRATSFAAGGAFIQPSFDSVRLPDALLQSTDDDADDSFLDSWVNSGGARAAAAADVDSASAARRSPEPAPLAWVPSSWTTAIDKAVMNANGCIQLSGNRLEEIPSLVSDLANLRAFEPRISASPFSRTQSSPAAAFHLRRSSGRTSSGSFGPTTFASASPTAVPVELHLGNNDITVDSISNSLWTLRNLHVLSLRQNRLESLPEGIGRLGSLHTLNVASNRLRYLPAEILQLENLAIVNLHPNPWLAPPAPSAPSSPDPDASPASEASPRRRRLLGPLTTHFKQPALKEVALRRLLAPSQPTATDLAQPLVKEYYTPDSMRQLEVPDHLYAYFLTVFQHTSSTASAPFSRVRQSSTSSTLSNASATVPTIAPFDPLSHVCHSLAHAGEPRVFVEPAVERFEWVSEASLKPASQQSTTKRALEARNIPLRWRGCSATCLDWLEEDEEELESESTLH